jgi:hypothetical protein
LGFRPAWSVGADLCLGLLAQPIDTGYRAGPWAARLPGQSASGEHRSAI